MRAVMTDRRTPDLDRFMQTALTLAETSRQIATRAWLGDMSISYKADGSALTAADLEIESRWREAIRHNHPDHGILGEEYGAETGQSAFTWVLDPIDGTRQFAAGLLNHAALIGLCRDGVPVLGVIALPLAGVACVAAEGCGTRFAGRSVRCSGQQDLSRAVISLANPDSFGPDAAGYSALRRAGRQRVFDGGSPAYGALARGCVDICLNGDDLDPFDICALCPVVQEAGGTITDWQGRPLSLTSRGAIVASASRALHTCVLERLTAAA